MNVEMLAWDADWSGDQTATFFDIFRKSLKDNLFRFFWGLAREFRILLHSLYSFSLHYVPWSLPDTTGLFGKVTAAVTSLVLIALSVPGFIRSGFDRRKKVLILLLVLGFYLPLSWYSITSPNRRYLLPVTVIFIAFAAGGVIVILKQWLESEWSVFRNRPSVHYGGLLKTALLLILTVFIVMYPMMRTIPHPCHTHRYDDGYQELNAYLKKHIIKNDKILTKGMHHYTWLLLEPGLESRRLHHDKFRNIDSFNKLINSNPNIRYYLIHQEVYRAVRGIFGEYLTMDTEKGLRLVKPLPGWRKVLEDRNGPVDFILLEKTKK